VPPAEGQVAPATKSKGPQATNDPNFLAFGKWGAPSSAGAGAEEEALGLRTRALSKARPRYKTTKGDSPLAQWGAPENPDARVPARKK